MLVTPLFVFLLDKNKVDINVTFNDDIKNLEFFTPQVYKLYMSE